MKKLTADKRTDLLRRYRSRVDSSLRWRSTDGYDRLWKKLVDLYRGKHFPHQHLTNEDRIAVNMVFATINVIAPSIAVNDPKMVVYSQKNEDHVKAVIVETVLNYWWRHYDFQSEVGLAVKDYLVIGHGWLKVGWRYVEELKAVKAQALTQVQDESEGGDAETPQDPKEKPANEPDDIETDADPEYEVTQDRPFVERVSFMDVFVDPEAKTLAEAKWIAQRMVKDLAQVQQDKRYRLAGRKNLTPDAQVTPDFRDDSDKISDDIKRCTLWEFYDLTLGTMCVFPERGDDFLLDPIPQPYVFGHPFIMLRNYEVPDFFYPMGDVEALEPLQMELDKVRSQMMNHRKRYDRKWLYRADSFDAQGASALALDQDMVMVPVANDSVPLNDVLVPIPITAVDSQLYNYEQGIQADLDKVSGVSEFQQGQAPEVRHTATEASMIADAANSRAADKLRQIEKGIGFIARRVVMLAQQYMTQDQEARVMGSNGYPVWIPFSREQVQGEFDFICEAGSTKPLNETQRRSQAVQMLQTFTPYASAGLVNAQELVKYALTMGFGVQNPDRFLMAQQPEQPGEAHKSPRQSIIETMNYKDAPPDIQRQMEQSAGFQPSEVAGSSPAEALMAKGMGPHIQAAAQGPQQAQQGQLQQALQAQQGQQQAEQLTAKHYHEASVKNEDHKHETAQAHREHEHRLVEGAAGHAQSIQQGEAQHEQAMQQADQGAEHDMTSQMMQSAMAPEGDKGPETTATTD